MSYMAKRNEPISQALRQAIADSGLSFKRLEKETGVLRQSLMKFAKGEQSLRGDFMDCLAVFFGLELRKRKSKKE
jgi:transcriptional regulator with XRE-family HTH domain